MAYETGTATDNNDLWDKLLAFLQTNDDLVDADQQWTVAWSAPDGAANASDIVLKGPGLSGTDDIYIGFRHVQRPTQDEYEFQLAAMTGVLDSAIAFNEHVNPCPHVVRMFADSNPMTYWFVASGRRFAVVVKISTIFEAMYGGFFLPYADPISYSYPIFIGGSAGDSPNAPTSWRSTDNNHAHFPHAYYDSNGGNPRASSAWMISPDGEWFQCAAAGSVATVNIGPMLFGVGLGTFQFQGNTRLGYADVIKRLQAAYGGDFLLTPHTLVSDVLPANTTFGILDGTFHVQGVSNSSENIVTIDDVDYLVVQDVFRTTIDAYWALRLE